MNMCYLRYMEVKRIENPMYKKEPAIGLVQPSSNECFSPENFCLNSD